MSDKIKCNRCSKLFASDIQLEQHRKEKHPGRKNSADLIEKAEDRLHDFLDSDGTDKALRELARVAAVVYNAESRKEASRNNQLTAALLTAKSITTDKNEIRRIVKRALPDHPISDALGELN